MANYQENTNGWGMGRIYGQADNVNELTAKKSQYGTREYQTDVNKLLYDDTVDKFRATIVVPHGAALTDVIAEIRTGVAFTGGTAPAVVVRDKATPADVITIDLLDTTHAATIAAEGVAYAKASVIDADLLLPAVGEKTLEVAVTGAPTDVEADLTITAFYRLP